MNTSSFNDTLVSIPTDSGGKDAFDNRPQTRFRGQDFDFKKPRFSERDLNPRIPLSVNRAKLSIPYKSELCLLFKRGKCYHGENCHFSHTVSVIRENTVCEMEECSYFARGEECPHADKCPYLHGRPHRESCTITVVNRGGDRSGSLNTGVYHVKTKTKLCINFERYGRCFYGEECKFAHGKAELRRHGSLAELEEGHTSGSKVAPEQDLTLLSEKELRTLQRMQEKGKGTIGKINKIYGDWIDDIDDRPSKD